MYACHADLFFFSILSIFILFFIENRYTVYLFTFGISAIDGPDLYMGESYKRTGFCVTPLHRSTHTISTVHEL